MKSEIKKCSIKTHKKYIAIIHCQICKLYMCEKCSIFHSKLFEDHKIINLNVDGNKIFTGICKKKNHNN